MRQEVGEGGSHLLHRRNWHRAKCELLASYLGVMIGSTLG